jgi:hypothetical protein
MIQQLINSVADNQSTILVATILQKLRLAYTIGALAIVTLVLFIAFAVTNFINFAIWIPAIPALIGLAAMAGAHIERLARRT